MICKNKNTAELVGLSFGDGGLTERKGTNRLRFQLRGDFSEDREHYNSHINPLFNKEIMNPLFGRNVGIVFNKNAGFYGISVESEKLIILNELGIPIGPKKELPIPDWIRTNDIYAKKFLRGLLDTDGSVFCQKNYNTKINRHTGIRIRIECSSEVLIKETCNLIKSFSIRCTFHTKNKKQKSHWSNTYCARIDGNIHIERWFKLIGSKNPKHITKFQIWKKFGFCPPYTTLEERKKILKGEINPNSYY